MRVLLVDHDSESLETVSRAIRGVLEIDCVTSKGDALLLLRQNNYDVLIACERCIDGSGLDLLGRTARTTVPIKRIFAAAPERLQLLGPRLAPFKVQRTINYPIDLEELWLAIAQVTSGPDDQTDGTIERVVLDERGIPAEGSVPRAPIPPRPPAPLSAVPSSPTPVMGNAGSTGRTAAARLTQLAPEPPLRPPPPPRQPPPVARQPAPPKSASDTGRMRALVPPVAPPPLQPAPPMAASASEDFPAWTPEPPPVDDFADVAAQARFGVQQKVADDSSRRKRQRVIAACGIAVVVAGTLVLLIENFYDPQARDREKAIAAQIELMSEQQKASDDLARIEIEIETAIMNNDFDTARRELAVLIEKAPSHPRHEFLAKSIDRAVELARLSPPAADGDKDQALAQTPTQATVLPAAAERTPARPRVERNVDRSADRATPRPPERSANARPRDAAAPPTRSYGAPIGESARQSQPALDAPINSAPVTTMRRNDNSFPGRTVEASDSAVGRAAPPPPVAQAPTPRAIAAPPSNAAGSAEVPNANVAPAQAPEPPAPVDVVPAKIVKRVTPVAPSNIPAKTKGYVVVRFSIGVNGRVSNLEVVESEPQGVFDEAAQNAVRKWIYEPRKEDGLAVESAAKARLVFEAAN